MGSGDAAGLAKQAQALCLMVRALSLVGLLAATFGPPHAYVVIRLVYGPAWARTEAPAVLAAFSVYILLLALNGARAPVPPTLACVAARRSH